MTDRAGVPDHDRSDPVPDEVRTELTRVVRRWQQLPLDHAQSCLPPVRALLTELAPLGGHDGIRAGVGVPDLGPGAVMDQLHVLVFDACAAGNAGDLAPRLVALLRALDRPGGRLS